MTKYREIIRLTGLVYMSTENSVNGSLKTRSLLTKFGTCSIAAEYSCAMKSHFRKSGNQMSGKWKSSYASLLA